MARLVGASLSALLLLSSTAPAATSLPQPDPTTDDIPAPRDTPYPGTIRLSIDATDVTRGIFRVTEVIPVAGPGPLTLRYPQWLPGHHSPSGPIDDVSGFAFVAGGQAIAWHRDPIDVYAIHLDVPAGATEVTATFQYLSPTAKDQGRVVMTPDMLNLQWNLVSFYPAGYFTRAIPVEATVTFPEGWRYGTALEPVTPGALGTVRFKPIDYENLVDSPIFAGRYFRQEQLAPDVRFDIVADRAEELAATPEQLTFHRRLVEQALKLFGTRHYDHYDFLLAISDRLGGIGLEHHRSSENGTSLGYFTKWNEQAGHHNVLPHEFTHSWNGKYRRGADLWTPDYATPMRNSLLWVYEGQTQFWGYVLQARSGMASKKDTLSAIAMFAALYDGRPGRIWRPLGDTTFDPILAQRRPEPWPSQQRSEDYYSEGLLLWLDVDARIRSLTNGRKSLDDFARAFFGRNDGDWDTSTYTFDDIVSTLNGVARFDWASFLRDRVDRPQPRAPLGWLEGSGYKLEFQAEPSAYWQSEEKARQVDDFSYSLGFSVGRGDKLAQVIWDSPAFAAGLTNDTILMAVNGRAYEADSLKEAVKEAMTTRKPIELLVRKGDRYSTVAIPYYDGPRYPRLVERGRDGTLDALLAPR